MAIEDDFARSDPAFRVQLRPLALFIAMACILLLLALPMALAVATLLLASWDIGLPIFIGVSIFVVLIGYAMSSSLQWVELHTDFIRARRLLTRQIVEKRIRDIVDAHAINNTSLGELENAILDYLLQTSDRGFVLQFRDGSRLPLIRADMTGLDQFLGTLAARMKAPRTKN